MAIDREQMLKKICRSLILLSDEGFYGTVEIPMQNGQPMLLRVIRQYKDGEMPVSTETRLKTLLGENGAA